jgi:hypothetical protein
MHSSLLLEYLRISLIKKKNNPCDKLGDGVGVCRAKIATKKKIRCYCPFKGIFCDSGVDYSNPP